MEKDTVFLNWRLNVSSMSTLQNFVSDKREAKILLKTNTQYTTLAENVKKENNRLQGGSELKINTIWIHKNSGDRM